MKGKLLVLVFVLFAVGAAISAPAPAAVSCSCESCARYSYCYDGIRQWDCYEYIYRYCF